MKISSMFASGLAILAVGGLSLAPVTANAGGWDHGRRSGQKDTWRDIAIGAGIVGVLGAIGHDRTLAAVGTGVAAYAAYRYAMECDEHGNWYHVERGRRVYVYDYVPSREDCRRYPDWEQRRYGGSYGQGSYGRGSHGYGGSYGRGGSYGHGYGRAGNRDRDDDRGRDRDRNRNWDRDRDRDGGRSSDGNRSGRQGTRDRNWDTSRGDSSRSGHSYGG